MNKIFKPYLRSLIKENIIYLLTLLLLIFLIIASTYINIKKLEENDKKTADLNVEVNDLQKRVTISNSSFADPGNLEENITILNRLIPGTEDFFSIIYSLEQLSKKTNFQIISYSVDMKKSNVNKLSISITGVGDNLSFIEFLKNYNFSGGRLITSNNIELSTQQSGAIKIDLSFYSKNIVAAQNSIPNLDTKLLEEFDALKQKISLDFKESTEEAISELSYPKKINPF